MAGPTTGANPSALRRTSWAAKWGAYDFGLLADVQPDIKFLMESIVTGTTGKLKLGDRFLGLDGTVKIQALQVDLQLFTATLPWQQNNTAGGLILTPPLNADLYEFADVMTLHPLDMGTDTTEDLILVKTVPTVAMNLKRTGKADDVWDLEFHVYPDRDKLMASPPVLYYGGIGVAA